MNRFDRQNRNLQIIQLRNIEGLSTEELSNKFSISKQMIRILLRSQPIAPIKFKCCVCGVETRSLLRRKFCSDKCVSESRKEYYKKYRTTPVEKECAKCESLFTSTKRSKRKYCSSCSKEVDRRYTTSFNGRNKEIIRLRNIDHLSYAEIGKRFGGLSRQRIEQICKSSRIKLQFISLKELYELYPNISRPILLQWRNKNLFRTSDNSGGRFILDAVKISQLPKMVFSKKCKVCGNLITNTKRSSFCSPGCVEKDRKRINSDSWRKFTSRNTIVKNCSICGKELMMNKYHLIKYHRKCYTGMTIRLVKNLMLEGFTTKEISDKLNKDYKYMQNVSRRIKKGV